MSDKISLNQQIEEVQREIALRESVYPSQVAKGRMRQSHADYHLARIRAVSHTLQWLMANELEIRRFLSLPAARRVAMVAQAEKDID